MSRINVIEAINELKKIEELPSRVGTTKSNLKVFGGPLKSAWDRKKHYREYRNIAGRIMARSIGRNWDTIVKAIKESMPEGIVEKYPWYLDRPDVMHQNSVTGYWHWQDYRGRLSLYGYETPKALKHSTSFEQYYLDNQNRLKLLPGRIKTYKRSKPTKSEQRQDEAYQGLLNFVKSKVDIYQKFTKNYWGRDKYDKKGIEVPSTKKELAYNEVGDIIEIDTPTTVRSYMTLNEFKNWCVVNNKTYFIDVENGYYTNLKLTYKQ